MSTFGGVSADVTVELQPSGLSSATYQQCSQQIRDAFRQMTSSVSSVSKLSPVNTCTASSLATYVATTQDGTGCYGAAEIRTAADSSLICVSCPAGYVGSGSGSCVKCNVGQYRDPEVSNVCLQCPSMARMTNSEPGLTSESECFRVCPKGMFSSTGYAPCNMCPPDTYSVSPTFCQNCAPNTFTRGPGQTSVSACQMQCSPGSFSSSGFSPCQFCPRGFYQPLARQTTCLECMDYETTLQEQSTSQTQCVSADVYFCEPNPCKNGGQCVVAGHDFQCICSKPIHTGRTCETLLDLCSSRPCYNKGSCVNYSNGSYACYCGTSRITGQRCEKDANDCEVNPCRHSGVCQDKLRSYTCHCPLFSGYTGSLCEIRRSPCSLEPCSAFNSRCVEYGNIGRTCICNRGYTGENCEINIDECASNPCMNGATCVDQVDGVLCQCRYGYTGELCEVRQSPCLTSPSPCGQQATCIDNYKLETVVCQCPDGYEEVGGRCQQSDLCRSSPCQNGGHCVFKNGIYQCSCPPGFDGARCENDANNCEPNPCLNNAACVDLFNDFHCNCDPKLPYTGGKYCKDLVDNCRPNPCQSSARCVDLLNDFYCVCPDGYYGKTCTFGRTDCDSFPCLHGATCVTNGDSYTCQCPLGYHGPDCQHETNFCSPDPCLNSAECISTDNTYFCKCKPGYRGDVCETYDNLCDLANPCIGPGSRCSFNGAETTCKCAQGYSGQYCEAKAVSCYPGYCLNGASCKENNGQLLCACVPGFTGDRCDVNIDDCQTNPCPPGSVCIDAVNSFICKCKSGKIGLQCNKDLSTDFDVVFPGALGYPASEYQSVPHPASQTELSVSVWVKYEQETTPGTIATLYGVSSASLPVVNPVELVSLRRLNVVASFAGVKQLSYNNAVVDDGFWHNIVVVWDSSFGRLSVYVDKVLSSSLSNYGFSKQLPPYVWLVLGGEFSVLTNTVDQSTGLRGRVSRLHITTTALSHPADIEQLYSDINVVPRGDIPGFNADIVDGINSLLDYQSQLTAGKCRQEDVSCRLLKLITARPKVRACVRDQMQVNSRVSVPRWLEPTFDSYRTVRTTLVSGGSVMGWGTYGVAYAAVDDQLNAAVCSFKFFNRRSKCVKPTRPVSGDHKCSEVADGLRCSVQCVATLTLSTAAPRYYTCGTYGMFGQSDQPVPFEYAPCTSCATPARDITISLDFRLIPACSSVVLNNLRESLLSALVTLNSEVNNKLCNTRDCKNVVISLVCNEKTTVISSTISLPLVSEEELQINSQKRPVRDFLVMAIVDDKIFNFLFAIPDLDMFMLKLKKTCVAGKQLIGDCCVECGQGSYYDSSVSGCVSCPKGTYLDETGVIGGTPIPCLSCPGSMTTAMSGAQNVDKCKDSCSVGQFYNLSEGQCANCPLGFYQSLTGSFYCTPCDVTMSTAYTGQTSIASCVTDPQVTTAPTTQGPTAGAATGASSFSAEMIAIIIIVVLILVVLFIILIICCCRDWVEKMCPCLIVKVGPEYEEKWHYVDRYGETNLKFVSYKLSEYRAKKMEKQQLVEPDKKIAVHVPLFEEKLNGTVSMKPVLIASMAPAKTSKPRKSKRSRKHRDEEKTEHRPKALPPLPDRLRADTLLTSSLPRRAELSVTYEIPVERSGRPHSAVRKKQTDDVPFDDFPQSASARTTPRSRITVDEDRDYR